MADKKQQQQNKIHVMYFLKGNTNCAFVTRVFTHFAPVACKCPEFCLVHWVVLPRVRTYPIPFATHAC